LAHQQFFRNIGHAPNRSTSLDPNCKIENLIVLPWTSPFQFINMGVELWAKPYGIRPRWYLKHLVEQIWEHIENPLRTWWEHIGNKGGKKIPFSPCPLEKKKTGPFMSALLSLPIGCMKYLFSKLFITSFEYANGKGKYFGNTVGLRRDNPGRHH